MLTTKFASTMTIIGRGRQADGSKRAAGLHRHPAIPTVGEARVTPRSDDVQGDLDPNPPVVVPGASASVPIKEGEGGVSRPDVPPRKFRRSSGRCGRGGAYTS